MIRKLCIIIILLVAPLLIMHQTTVLAACDAKCQVQGGVDTGAGGAPATPTTIDETIKTVINLFSVIVGIAAIVMIIVAGLRYTTSAGNAEKIKSAKNTLIYALIGLVVVALSQTIAHFVLSEANNPSTATPAKKAP